MEQGWESPGSGKLQAGAIMAAVAERKRRGEISVNILFFLLAALFRGLFLQSQ
jgi:hypothetical protein